MFYFKDAGISPSKIDPVQLQKVQEFKQRISDEYGGLYHSFETTDQFQSMVRIHLSKVVQDWLDINNPLPILQSTSDMALELKNYYTQNGVYPWLAGFRNPRAGSSGTATGGSAMSLVDTTADFGADGVKIDDVVVNSTGGSGVVTNVMATQLDFGELLGGIDNAFDVGEGYDVRPSFKSTKSTLIPPVASGQLPVHRENEIFATRFDASWDISNVTENPDPRPPSPTLVPDDNRIQHISPENEITVTKENGRCMWTEAARVDCVGTQVDSSFWRADLGTSVERTIHVSFSFTGDSVTVVPATANDVRRRDVSIGVPSGVTLPVPSIATAPLLPQNDWFIIVSDYDGTNTETMRIDLKSTTDGWIAVDNIRYDLSVISNNTDDPVTADPLDPWDEVPEWFAENNWPHFIYAEFPPDFVGGGDGDCSGPPITCVTLNAAGSQVLPDDIRALLVSAGAQLSTQDRDTSFGCTGVEYLCEYFEGDNSDIPSPNTFSRNGFSAGFNDQVRIVDPPPP